MTKTCTSTQNEIVRYLYNETSSSENVFIETSLLINTEFLDFYLECNDIKDELAKIALSPKDKTITNILNFSKNYKPTMLS
jgi:hypothetical protein